MTYEQGKNLKPEHIKRLSGVQRETFAQMVEVVRAHSQLKQKTGRPGVNDIGILDRVQNLLSY